MVSRPCGVERRHQGIAQEHGRIQVRLGLRTREDRKGAPGNRGSSFSAPAAQTLSFVLAALVEPRELVHEVVETPAGGRKLAQRKPGKPARRRRPQQQGKVCEIATLNENFNKIGHGSAPPSARNTANTARRKRRPPLPRRAPLAGVNCSPALPQLDGSNWRTRPRPRPRRNRSRGASR